MFDEIKFELSTENRQQLYEGLLSAFPSRDKLALMLYLKLDVNLEVVAPDAATLDIVVGKLIIWAIAEGRIGELVIGAREQNPGNQDLRAFDEQILRPRQPKLPKVDGGQMVSPPGLIGPTEKFSFFDVGSVGNWYMNMRNAAAAVCRIEMYDHLATGFLIGPNLVLTCYHVVASIIETSYYEDPVTKRRTPMSPQSVTLRFGYSRATDGLTLNEGWIYHLASDWLADSSPVDELNYALLRVDGLSGKGRIIDFEQPGQRWLSPALDYEFQPGADLLMLQHPEGRPLQVSYGTVASVNDQGTSVTYMIPAAPGSSGAACFSARWELVAMHQSRVPDTLNRQGLPIAAFMSQARVQAELART